jgi:V/A-type H+-transporting ATPase subunit E
MSLEKILERITHDAQAETDKILSESQKKAEEIKETAQKEAEGLAEALIEEAERKARLEASRVVTQARLEKRIKILSWKKELIDDILEKALQKANLGQDKLKKKIILKDGEREESYHSDKLLEELRPKLENYILKVLKI